MSVTNLFPSLNAALLGMAGVTALVGGSDPKTARIWNSWQRVNAYPCIVVEIDDEDEQNDLQAQPDLVIAEVTITCRANTDDESDALQQAVRAGLAGYSGAFDAILDHTAHSETPRNDGSKLHWYDRVMSFTMIWNEA